MYHYVYILQSIPYPEKYYVGSTTNLKDRIHKHNEGGTPYTSQYKPWQLNTAFRSMINTKH